jgi:hypothetical protein
MKFKNDPSVSSEKKTVEHQESSSSAPKMVKPLNVVPPAKPIRKPAAKSSSKKKKSTKKGESKVALTMSDLYEKENPFKATEKGSSAVGDTPKNSSDVATPGCEKGNPV